MARRIRELEDYPFGEIVLEGTLLEIEGFVADPPPTAAERIELLEFVRLTHQFAFLERLIQGEVFFELPVHLDLPSADVEALANEERGLLSLGMEPAESLLDALDERGIKVLRRDRGPESPDILTGGFHYLGELGPSLLVGAAEGSREASFILAHEYGHLVMDVNPYRSRFCRWRRSNLENLSSSQEEIRADRFARALLLPQELVRTFAIEPVGDGVDEESRRSGIVHMAEVCEVAPAVLWRRLADLDMRRSEQAPPASRLRASRRVDERRPTGLPERFVNLALAAFGQRMLQKPDLVRFLRIPPERLEQFLAWCPIPRVRKGSEPLPDESDGGAS
ncbi:MAG: ImmA/IrrE family metallo-endopeptidase [Candidatus Eisenbacteria bacterium]|nr:ImmA/IrrE family metallo-endopeptidase [Candidatus Eisenbacteria bacterium]